MKCSNNIRKPTIAGKIAVKTTVYLKEKCIAEMSILLLWFNKIFGVWTLAVQFGVISVTVLDMTIAILNQSIRALLAAATTAWSDIFPRRYSLPETFPPI